MELYELGIKAAQEGLAKGEFSSVDVEGVEPMMHGRPLVNAFREDVVRPSLDTQVALENAPKRVGDESLLPKIVEGAES